MKRLVIVNPGLIDTLEPGDAVMDWDREKSSVTDENGNTVGYIDMNDGTSIRVWIETDRLTAQPYDDLDDRQRADRIDDICDSLIEENVPPEVCQQVRAYAAWLRMQARKAEANG